jgi:two-component system, LytTR family, sensor histidine kinase AlgZ
MHPILARRGRLLPYLAACAPLAAVVTALLARRGGVSLPAAAALAVPLTLAYAFIGLSAWYPCKQFPLGRSRIPRMVATFAAGALVTSALWVLLGDGLARLYGGLPQFKGLPAQYAAQVPALFAAGVLLYFLYAALHYVLLSLEATREAERREAQMQILAREAELAALKAQIQPHFLFNSLNSISSLAGSDPPRAQEMCVRLADFLRKSLAVGETPSIAMGEELALSRAYLSVEELRFGPRLAFEEDLDERGGRCMVPPLLLQPLVENAIRHGIATCVEGGTVRLAVRFAAGRLRILVENPYDPESPARAGVGMGLANVRKRLAARYGSEALFAAKRLKDRFLVVISVPAELPA